MSNQRYLIWHPSVHALFRDELVFYLLTVSTFPKDLVLNELQKLLAKTGHSTYRIYRVFGTYDLFLKVWVHKGTADDFAKDLQKCEYIDRATPLVVDSIPHHWKYKDGQPTAEAISRLRSDSIRPIQECFGDPATWASDLIRKALDNMLVRIVEETTGKIMIFTGIRCPEIDGVDVKALLEGIYSLFRAFESDLDKPAVYLTKGQFLLLVKFETADFFQIGTFITELTHSVATSRCATVTSVVVDQTILGNEEIGRRSFQQVERRDFATLNILPEVYEIDDLDPQKRAQIEHWINHELVRHRDRLNEREFKGIRTCLVAVLFDDEESFLSTILQLYGPIERELRRLLGEFIGKLMGSENVGKTIKDALSRHPNAELKRLDLLSLGDKLDLFVYVIKSKQLSTDPKVIGSWTDEARLRDEAAHFSEKPFPNWNTELAVLVNFLIRYKALLAIIRAHTNGKP